jgi:hypothetical protein
LKQHEPDLLDIPEDRDDLRWVSAYDEDIGPISGLGWCRYGPPRNSRLRRVSLPMSNPENLLGGVTLWVISALSVFRDQLVAAEMTVKYDYPLVGVWHGAVETVNQRP